MLAPKRREDKVSFKVREKGDFRTRSVAWFDRLLAAICPASLSDVLRLALRGAAVNSSEVDSSVGTDQFGRIGAGGARGARGVEGDTVEGPICVSASVGVGEMEVSMEVSMMVELAAVILVMKDLRV